MKHVFIVICLLFSYLLSKGQIINTIAGNGNGRFGGDGGPATNASIWGANGICVDTAGNIFIADYGNNRIRKITNTGIINTIAGDSIAGGFSGDGGQATNARLFCPASVIIDNGGNLYIADEANDRIRKVTPSGIISTFAGTTSGFSGDGGQATNAQLFRPNGIALDRYGNMYIADMLNSRVRKIDTLGIISTIAGIGIAGYSGDGGLATNAQLNMPYGLATDGLGNIFIADYNNYLIRKVNTEGNITS